MAPSPFDAPAEQYDRFMGRYLPTLGVALADLAGVAGAMRVLDVGCGPGGLTVELARRVGGDAVAAIDPAPQFAAACAERVPGADVRVGVAEALPWADDVFDAALCSLVVHFMTDPVGGIGELARVTRPGGVVAACVWDFATGGMTMLQTFWTAVRTVTPDVGGEDDVPGGAPGDLERIFTAAKLVDIAEGELTATADYAGADDFWEPFTYGVGPAGGYLRTLEPAQQEAVRAACVAHLPAGPFTLTARAWCARGTVPA